MIHVEEPVMLELAPMHDMLEGCDTLGEKVKQAIHICKALDIHGCITGSCFLPGFDPDLWGSTPDLDIFVYSEDDLIRAITLAKDVLKMQPGTGSKRSEAQETWKIERLYENGVNWKTGLSTYKFYCDGIILNFSYKMRKIQGRWCPIATAPDVLMSFDMSIVMQAYDIKSHVHFDLRPDNVPATTAIVNPLRKQDTMMWTVAKWIRQFDRVVKYYDRGFDTRPVARTYIRWIDECIEAGCLFDSEASTEAFERFGEEFLQARARIADWLEAKED